MRERHREADRPVAAHADIADIVEEDDASGACGIVRFAQERPNDRVVAARLVDGEAAEMIELAGEAGASFSKRTVAERWSPIHDHAGGFTLGMGIDDPHRVQSLAPGQEAYQARNVIKRRFAMLSCDGLRTSKSLRCNAYSSWPTSVIRRLK